MSSLRSKRAFTLLELAIVIVILIILAAAGLRALTLKSLAEITKIQDDLVRITQAYQSFSATYDVYPGNLDPTACAKIPALSSVSGFCATLPTGNSSLSAPATDVGTSSNATFVNSYLARTLSAVIGGDALPSVLASLSDAGCHNGTSYVACNNPATAINIMDYNSSTRAHFLGRNGIIYIVLGTPSAGALDSYVPGYTTAGTNVISETSAFPRNSSYIMVTKPLPVSCNSNVMTCTSGDTALNAVDSQRFASKFGEGKPISQSLLFIRHSSARQSTAPSDGYTSYCHNDPLGLGAVTTGSVTLTDTFVTSSDLAHGCNFLKIIPSAENY